MGACLKLNRKRPSRVTELMRFFEEFTSAKDDRIHERSKAKGREEEMRKSEHRDDNLSRYRSHRMEDDYRRTSSQNHRVERVSNIEDDQRQRRQESRCQDEERQDVKPRDALPPRNPRPFYCEIHGEGKGHTPKCAHM